MNMIYKKPIRMIPPVEVIVQVQILAAIQNYNHNFCNVPKMWEKTRGKGIKVAILDTGIAPHNDLNPKRVASFVEDLGEDRTGHGTHVSGLLAGIGYNEMGVLGVAPDVELYPIKVLGDDGSGTLESIISGIYLAVNTYGVNVINMSLGVHAEEQFKELEKACDYAASKNVVICAASGNDASFVDQPARYESVLAIASVNNKQEHSSFSNFGDAVDFAAGGSKLYSTYLNNGYAVLSGTSMASPIIAGIASLIIADAKLNKESLTFNEVKEKLKKISLDLGVSGFDPIYGWGMPVFKSNGVNNENKD